jgi:S1-C subfamily serine protease
MHIFRHIHMRAALLAVIGLLAVGSGAAYAATRTTAPKIGTGVVVINTQLGYQSASAAGTGMVLTSSGEILTNNHVIAGATKITVVVPNTTHRYTARVVGYDVSDDVAVLQLQSASNLKTVTVATASVKLGTRVTAVGNAGGTGTLASASGIVTGLNKSITASDENGSSETLTGLIETNAALRPGDSGGPLETSTGKVVGMDTAASTGSPFADYATDAYAIPINKALAIAKQIVAGKSSATVHVGGTAFFGIQIADTPQGAQIVGVVSGGPAATAGLGTGDVITAINGQSVGAASDVQSILQTLKPGAKATVTYTDMTGAQQTATVTLGSGPPQ